MTTICATAITQAQTIHSKHLSSERLVDSSAAPVQPMSDRESRNTDVKYFGSIQTVIGHFFKKLAIRIKIREQQKIDRDAFSHMLALSDQQLIDIGVTRENVRWAAQLPLEENAALALREVTYGESRE